MGLDEARLAELKPTTDPAATEPLKLRKSKWQKLWADPVARISFVILMFLYLCAAFADPVTPYSMTYNDPDLANAPPTTVYMQDDNGNWTEPYVFVVKRTFNKATMAQEYTEDESKRYYVKLFVHGEPYKILGLIPSDIHLFGVDDPARIFLLGSDINGRDNWSRLFFGAQKSLTIGFLGLFISFPIGILYGGISGFLGGWTDTIMMRVAEAIMSIPTLHYNDACSGSNHVDSNVLPVDRAGRVAARKYVWFPAIRPDYSHSVIHRLGQFGQNHTRNGAGN